MVKLVEENKLKREDILKLYTKGYTNPEDFKIGIEYERLPISTSVYNEVDYWSGNGIKQFLEKYSLDETWDYILDDKNIIGLKKGHDTITLEPGAHCHSRHRILRRDCSACPYMSSFRCCSWLQP